MMKIFPALLLPLVTFLTGVCPSRREELQMYVRAGEMVALQCPCCIGHNPNNDTRLFWTSHITHEMHASDHMSSAGQRQILIHGGSLVILNASVSHQGNYSCSLGNSSERFRFALTVFTTQHDENDENKYSAVCDAQESCTLTCPEVNISDLRALLIFSVNNIMWRKEGESLPNNGYFSGVEEKDQGDYTCTRSYLHNSQVYNMTFTVDLKVQPKANPGKPQILSPTKTVFYVDLGSLVEIECKAVVYSNFDELFWLSDTAFVVLNDSFPVFYTYHASNSKNEEINLTASLVFKKVSQEDLSRQYRCKLESVSEQAQFVTVTLVRKAPSFSLPLTLSLVGLLLVIAVVVVCVKFKIHITPFLTDAISRHHSISDGKNYDAFFMCYEGETDAGLDTDTRQWLESVLQEKFGYNLCLHDRDDVPESAEAEAVLDCIKQSRTVVLVPTSARCGLRPAAFSNIYSALVEQQHHLVVINTETTAVPSSGLLPRALQNLGKAVDTVTWKGASSKSHDSSFFKELRYYLSAPQHPPKDRLSPVSYPV